VCSFLRVAILRRLKACPTQTCFGRSQGKSHAFSFFAHPTEPQTLKLFYPDLLNKIIYLGRPFDFFTLFLAQKHLNFN
jgi:hypothetical protein